MKLYLLIISILSISLSVFAGKKPSEMTIAERLSAIETVSSSYIEILANLEEAGPKAVEHVFGRPALCERLGRAKASIEVLRLLRAGDAKEEARLDQLLSKTADYRSNHCVEP